MFTVEERLATVEREIAALTDGAEICVVSFDSLLMDFAEAQGASMIVRGLRAVADFEYEYQMAGMNQQLNDDIETVFLMADVSLQPIASNLVKEIARFGGGIDKFVTPAVAARCASGSSGPGARALEARGLRSRNQASHRESGYSNVAFVVDRRRPCRPVLRQPCRRAGAHRPRARGQDRAAAAAAHRRRTPGTSIFPPAAGSRSSSAPTSRRTRSSGSRR